jgi:hypothetical protein
MLILILHMNIGGLQVSQHRTTGMKYTKQWDFELDFYPFCSFREMI